VLCQVPPGFTRALPMPSDRLFYQVETLVFGRAVERATRPERYIVGCADPAKMLPEVFAAVLGAFGCPILPMRYESAELAKIAINCCLVGSVTIANTPAGTFRAGRGRLERDRAGAQARRPHRAGCLSRAWAGHRRWQSRARSCDHRAHIAAERFRRERYPRLRRQQPSSPRLGDAGAA